MISELSAESKYAVLVKGVYHYFYVNFGSVEVNRRHRARQNKRQNRLARQVKEAKVLKNDARRELMQAKKSASLSQEQVQSKCSSIAKKFFQSVRSHNKLTRALRQSQVGSIYTKSSPSSMSWKSVEV